jgi:SAM-dependent methyltransferase
MVEDVDEHEVRQSSGAVRQRFCVNDLVRPPRRLDVGRDYFGPNLLEVPDAGAQFNSWPWNPREIGSDQLVPSPVQPPEERPFAPGALLLGKLGAERCAGLGRLLGFPRVHRGIVTGKLFGGVRRSLGYARAVAVADTSAVVDRGSAGAEYAELVDFFDEFAPSERRWRKRTRGYHRLIEQIFRFHIPPGQSVLEIGSGGGELLAALDPSRGTGVDISGGMIDLAHERHAGIRFERAAGERIDLGETFDYVVLADLVPYVYDILGLFDRVLAHSHSRTRVVIESYSRAWRPLLRIAEVLRLKPRMPIRNWVSPADVVNLLDLSGFEVIVLTRRILLPMRVPVLSMLLNGFLANLWPFNHLCLTYWIVARPRSRAQDERPVTIVCPCRNEEGHIGELVRRVAPIGPATELLFVEGNSTDGTRAEIERQIELNPERDIRLVQQTGKGKGDAVRTGFAAAKHDVLMILDGDLSVRPEELPKFYRALSEGHGELINGSRLVYDMEPGSMQFLNVLGNKTFSRLFKVVTGQQMKDTLCGTKVLFKRDYEQIARGRSYFGDFDPFGDFDLLLGASRLGLKIVDLPIRYQPRSYGTTNISRWRHGVLLLRMTVFAFWKFKIALFSQPAR